MLYGATGAALVCFLPALYLPVPPAVLAGISLFLCAATVWVTRRLAQGVDPAAVTRVDLAVLLVIMCESLVASHPGVYFFSWWRWGTALKEPPAGVVTNELKSFPSAHTANAANMLFLGLAPCHKPRLQKYQKALVSF